MYSLETEASFDSAHFLFGYEGKCANLHGHRWKIVASIKSNELVQNGQLRGMIVDFGDLKRDLKNLADEFDHCLIYEEGSLKAKTIEALAEENFKMIAVSFRPTAENFAAYFYGRMKRFGYDLKSVTVYETPNNCATYTE